MNGERGCPYDHFNDCNKEQCELWVLDNCVHVTNNFALTAIYKELAKLTEKEG